MGGGGLSKCTRHNIYIPLLNSERRQENAGGEGGAGQTQGRVDTSSGFYIVRFHAFKINLIETKDVAGKVEKIYNPKICNFMVFYPVLMQIFQFLFFHFSPKSSFFS